MAVMFLVHQVCELNKTTVGDVAIEKINNLTLEEVRNIIKSKDRNEIPVAWDLKDNLELAHLDVCCIDQTTPYQNLCNAFEKADKLFLGKITIVGDTYVSEKGFRCIYINGIERLYYKEEDENEVQTQVSKPSEPKSKYLKWEDLVTAKTYNCLLNGAEYKVCLFMPEGTNPFWKARLISEKSEVWTFINERNKQFFNDLHLEVIE